MIGRIRSRVVGALLASALGLAASAAAQPGGGPPPARVVLDEVRLEQIEQWREVTGELRAARRSVLAAQEEGLVLQVAVEAGDEVRAGQVVARLDDTRARIDVDRATALVAVRAAEVDEARAAVEQALRNHGRIEESFQRASASRQELDDAGTTVAATQARLARAQADLQSAQADLARARKRLADMEIVSPFAGRIIEKRTEAGQWVTPGDAVLEVVALDWIDAWLDVPEALVDFVGAPGATVQVRVAALAPTRPGLPAETHEAPVAAVVPSADRLSRLFPVRVRLDNRPPGESSGSESGGNGGGGEGVWGGRLRPGMSVVGLVRAGERRPTLTVHKDAILRSDTGAYVYMDADGVAAIARVEPLFAVGKGDRLAVRSDMLRPGMRVVIEGNERMFPGQPLMPIGGPAAAGGSGPAGGAGGADGNAAQGG